MWWDSCVCTYIYKGTCSLIIWSKKLSKTHGTINLCYELILVHNGKFGQEHVNCQKLFINSSMICYMDLSCVFFLLFSLFLTFVLFHFLFLFFLLYESSPSSLYFVLVHLNNFWPYQALLSRFFIMNGDFWGLPHCLGVHLDNFWSYWAFLSWFFIMNGDFWGFSYCLGLSFCNKCGGAR